MLTSFDVLPRSEKRLQTMTQQFLCLMGWQTLWYQRRYIFCSFAGETADTGGKLIPYKYYILICLNQIDPVIERMKQFSSFAATWSFGALFKKAVTIL
jgi:hypothetical protein